MRTSTDTRADLLRALGVFAEPPGPQHCRLADLLGVPAPTGSDWTEAFTVQLVPHASIYLGAEGMLGGDAAERVAGFWRALRIPVPADADHLTTLLGLYATLIEAQASEPDGPRKVLFGHARAALLHEHLLSWLLAYTDAMSEVAPTPYAAWADVLGQAVRGEAAEVGAPDLLPAHLRAAPPPATAHDNLDAVLAYLLSPARSGVVLARGHLAALARDGDLGLRMGDRRRILRALVEQDPGTALPILAEWAGTRAVRHRADTALAGPILAHWAERAAATATLLRTGIAVQENATPQPPSPPEGSSADEHRNTHA
ncbi:molecular chaperone TorD family protein [Actinoplanes sp. NPDC049316]|uniref:molecular chaperone TorD family protein n=1 Tax=Actinoplanes sp. NPDC049316 TaxID=3154727 RepID=UPI0034338BB3